MSLLGSGTSSIAMFDVQTRTFPMLQCAGDNVAFSTDYIEHYAAIDPRADFANTIRSSTVLYDYLWTDEAGLKASDYHNWQIREFGEKYTLGLGTFFGDRIVAALFAGRTAKQGHADDEQIDLCRVLLPHFSRAVEISQNLGHVPAKDVLESLRIGVVLLDHDGRVLFANHSARTMAASVDGFDLATRGIACRRSVDQSVLDALIGAAATNGMTRGGQLLIPRKTGRAPFVVSVSPWSGEPPDLGGGRPAVMVTIADPAVRTESAERCLAGLFGLSEAEARLAMLMYEGLALKEASIRSGVTMNTLKTQLKSIFRKTEARRQSDLVKLVSVAMVSGTRAS